MPFTITMKEGEDFYLNDERVKMIRLVTGQDFTLEVNGYPFKPNQDDWLPLTDGVQVQAGYSKTSKSRLAKVRLQAEPGIRVLRGKQYRAFKAQEEK